MGSPEILLVSSCGEIYFSFTKPAEVMRTGHCLAKSVSYILHSYNRLQTCHSRTLHRPRASCCVDHGGRVQWRPFPHFVTHRWVWVETEWSGVLTLWGKWLFWQIRAVKKTTLSWGHFVHLHLRLLLCHGGDGRRSCPQVGPRSCTVWLA